MRHLQGDEYCPQAEADQHDCTTMKISSLGYVGIETTELSRWRHFATD
ncbi:MAG: hypothetical protein O7F73_13835 [Gammaproteobacteria bacterium]|nr:hypothetical protein [Gammaproteobacteria bacterium]